MGFFWVFFFSYYLFTFPGFANVCSFHWGLEIEVPSCIEGRRLLLVIQPGSPATWQRNFQSSLLLARALLKGSSEQERLPPFVWMYPSIMYLGTNADYTFWISKCSLQKAEKAAWTKYWSNPQQMRKKASCGKYKIAARKATELVYCQGNLPCFL